MSDVQAPGAMPQEMPQIAPPDTPQIEPPSVPENPVPGGTPALGSGHSADPRSRNRGDASGGPKPGDGDVAPSVASAIRERARSGRQQVVVARSMWALDALVKRVSRWLSSSPQVVGWDCSGGLDSQRLLKCTQGISGTTFYLYEGNHVHSQSCPASWDRGCHRRVGTCGRAAHVAGGAGQARRAALQHH